MSSVVDCAWRLEDRKLLLYNISETLFLFRLFASFFELVYSPLVHLMFLCRLCLCFKITRVCIGVVVVYLSVRPFICLSVCL